MTTTQEAIGTMLAVFEKYKSGGHVTQRNGTQLAGHLPHLAPKAYLHELPLPATTRAIRRMEKELKKELPEDLIALYKGFNGFSVFHGGLNLFGSTHGNRFSIDERLPFPLVGGNHSLKVPPETTQDILYIGTFGMDASLAYVDLNDGTVHRTTRSELKKLASWDSIADWILIEVLRLDKIVEDIRPFEMLGEEYLPWGQRVR